MLSDFACADLIILYDLPLAVRGVKTSNMYTRLLKLINESIFINFLDGLQLDRSTFSVTHEWFQSSKTIKEDSFTKDIE